jgi:hypothetical protein
MNSKTLGALVLGAVIGLGIGYLLGTKSQGNVPTGLVPTKMAYIVMDAKHACTQHTGKVDGPEEPFPTLKEATLPSGSGTITWSGPNASPTGRVVAEFPQGTESDPGTPFEFAGSGTRRTTFGQGDNSGPPEVGASKDYPYFSLTIGGVPCTNPQTMGVHIDK